MAAAFLFHPQSENHAMRRMMKLATLLLSCVSVINLMAQGKPTADLIITNARVWTVDKAHPTAQAVAVFGDRIIAVGSKVDVEVLRGVETKVVDAGGKLLIPGFNDAHVHFVTSGARLDQIQLSDATSLNEFTRRIAERAKMTPKGEWIEGGDWDETKWTPANLPTKDVIDSVTPDNPVFLEHHDGHMALANSVALRLAGATAQTPDPPGGTIVRDAQGNPTGALKDAARNVVLKVIPPLSHDQRLQAMQRALERAAELGVTSFQDMNDENSDSFADIRGYGELLQSGELTARVYVAPAVSDWHEQAKVGIRQAFGSPFLRIGATKGFADGSLGSGTAYFFDPYNDDPNNSGLLGEQMHPLSQMRDWIMQADAAGLQICTHAIGDRAISTVLDLYTDVVRAHHGMERRLRIEHAQHMAAKDFARFAQLDVIASVQPYQAIDDGRWAEGRIGHDRASRTYAFRTFLNHGVHLAFGTDWPYAPLDPVLTVFAAVTRATLDGKNPNGWFPEQKLTVAEAVEAYTIGSAYAEFQEKEKGSITPGKLADMVLLSEDILSLDPVKIRDVKVLKTIVGGKVVWDQDRKKQYSTAN
jgi:predicted amidohydrolase YtcJ